MLKLPQSMKTAGVLACLATGLSAADASYFRDIRPILQRQCQGCHQPNLKSSNLDLTTYEGLAAGRQTRPGARADREISHGRDRSRRCRWGSRHSPAEQIELVRDWVAAGRQGRYAAPRRVRPPPPSPIVYTQPPVMTALAFSPDGKVARRLGQSRSADPRAGRQRAAETAARASRTASSRWRSPRMGRCWSAGGGTPARFGEIQLWELRAGTLRRSVMLTGDTVFGVSLSPDGIARRGRVHRQHGSHRRDRHR